MFGIFNPRCSVCGKALEGKVQRSVEGKEVSVCPACNELLELQANTPAFRKGFEFAHFRKKATGCSTGLTLLAFFATLWFGVSLLSVLFSPSRKPTAKLEQPATPMVSPEQPSASKIEPPPSPKPDSPAEATTPESLVPHRVLKRVETSAQKVSIGVEVPLVNKQLPTQQQLESLCRSLANEETPRRKNVSLVFYLPGMILGAGGFATGHVDSRVSVELQLSNLRSYPQYQRFLPRSASPAIFPTENRKWRTSDGRQLTGRVVDLDVKTRTVTLIREDGVKIENYPLDKLHPDDQALILRLRR